MPLGASRLSFLAKTAAAVAADRTAYDITAVGSAQVDTAQSQFGNSSAYFSTGEDALRITNGIDDLGSTWTFECWFRAESLQDNNYLLHNNGIVWLGGPSRSSHSNEVILMIPSAEGGGAVYYTSYTAVSGGWQTGQWYHLAVVHDNGDTEVFVNGTSLGSFATNSVLFTDTKDLEFGKHLSTSGQDFNGWIDEIRISNTARYTTGFTPSTTPFVNDANTVFLCHADGTDGDTVFIDDNGDRAPIGIQALNGASISTAQSKFGNSSFVFDGTNDLLKLSTSTTNIDLSGDFSIEGFVRFASIGSNQKFFDLRNRNGSGGPFLTDTLLIDYSSGFRCFVDGSNRASGTPTASTGQWYHVALSRTGSVLEFYVDGTRYANYDQTTAKDYTLDYDAVIATNGEYADQTQVQTFDGYMDEIRFSNTARYTGASITVPTSAFENDSNTLLLLHAEQVDADTTVIFDDNGGTLPTYVEATSDTSISFAGGDYGYIDAFPNTSTSNSYSFFSWVKFDNANLSDNSFVFESFRNGISAFRLEKYQSKLMVNGFNSSNSPMYRAQHNSTISGDTWYAVWVSIDPSSTSNRSFCYQQYGSSTVNVVTSSNSAFYANITGSYQSGFYDEAKDIGIFARGANGAVASRGDLAEFWMDDVYRDFTSSTNRQKFVDSSGYPVDLGSDGSTPFGAAPPIYIAGSDMLTNNRGDSGDNPTYVGSPPNGDSVGS